MSKGSKIVKLAKETAQLRAELLVAEIEEGTLTVELSNADLSAIVYSLALSWLSEYVNGMEGEERILNLIGGASSAILAADAAPHIEDAINRILGDADAA